MPRRSAGKSSGKPQLLGIVLCCAAGLWATLETAADAVKRRNYPFAVKLYSQLSA